MQKGILFLSFGGSSAQECRARQREGRHEELCLGTWVRVTLSGSPSEEAGGRQDQSTLRVIFGLCLGKGSDVRY